MGRDVRAIHLFLYRPQSTEAVNQPARKYKQMFTVSFFQLFPSTIFHLQCLYLSSKARQQHWTLFATAQAPAHYSKGKGQGLSKEQEDINIPSAVEDPVFWKRSIADCAPCKVNRIWGLGCSMVIRAGFRFLSLLPCQPHHVCVLSQSCRGGNV